MIEKQKILAIDKEINVIVIIYIFAFLSDSTFANASNADKIEDEKSRNTPINKIIKIS